MRAEHEKNDGISLIEGARRVNGTVAYWFEPNLGDTDCTFGVKSDNGWYLETCPGPYPSSPEDEETIKTHIAYLWTQGESKDVHGISYWQYRRDSYESERKFVEGFIALAADYGLTLIVE